MYIVVTRNNVGSARADTLPLAKAMASDIDGYVKLFADWKGPNKKEFIKPSDACYWQYK